MPTISTSIDNNIQIILAEDNQTTADLTINAFRKNNVKNDIVHLTDGQELLNYIYDSVNVDEKYSPILPKIILLDLKMPKVNGMEVLMQLKSNSQTKHFPIIVLSSCDLESDIHQCYELGANSYIVKPVSFSEFIITIKGLSNYWLTHNKIVD
jgi:two-component system response regulator